MKRKILILFWLTSFVCLPTSHGANSAMRCVIEPRSVKGALQLSAAVFLGEVVEIKKGGNFIDARFRVERYWKGIQTEEVSVIALNDTAESPHYRVGEKYLVFASIQNGKLFTGNCSRTKKVEDAKRDLKQLGEGRSAAARNVRPLPTPLDLTNASATELQQHLGQTVTMRGRFSLNGKIGPFIVVGASPIYLEAQGSFSWGKSYARMEGREVRVTGTLRFAHYPEPQRQDLAVGRPDDHFYFEAQTAKVELIER